MPVRATHRSGPFEVRSKASNRFAPARTASYKTHKAPGNEAKASRRDSAAMTLSLLAHLCFARQKPESRKPIAKSERPSIVHCLLVQNLATLSRTRSTASRDRLTLVGLSDLIGICRIFHALVVSRSQVARKAQRDAPRAVSLHAHQRHT